MVGCSAYGCSSRSEKKLPGITFHRFPLKDTKRLKIWIQRMRLLDFVPTKNDKLCSVHFEKRCFYWIGEKTFLLDNSVPSVFEELPEYLQELPQQKKAMKRSRQEFEESSTPVEPVGQPSRVVARSSTVEPTVDESPREKKLRRELFHQVVKNRVQCKKLRVLGQKLKRYNMKIVSLKQLVNDLTKKTQILVEESNSLSS